MSHSIMIPTWRCEVCDYSQDFDPTDDEKMTKNFRSAKASCDKTRSVKNGECPSCFMKGSTGVMMRATSANGKPKTSVCIMDEADVDALVVWREGDSKLVVVPKVKADELTESLRKAHNKDENKKEFEAAMSEGRLPDFKKPKEAFDAPKFRDMTKSEKETLKSKVRSELAIWRARECAL